MISTTARIIDTIKKLHAEKHAMYGDAWKKRGEVMSILPNIARKVDRLVRYAELGTTTPIESVFDTAADLWVYLLKYRLFLLENAPLALLESEGHPSWLSSETVEAFNVFADYYTHFPIPEVSTQQVITDIESRFETLCDRTVAQLASIRERLDAARDMSDWAFILTLRFSDGACV